MDEILVPDEEPELVYEKGRLDVDPADGRLRCHLCGETFKNLARHALGTHHLSADEYRTLTGLNRKTPLISERLREWTRQADIPVIDRLRAEGKMRRFDEDPEKAVRARALGRTTIKQGWSPQTLRERRENWTEERRSARAELMRQRNLSGVMTGKIATCARCGVPFRTTSSTNTYCQPCRPERDRERRQEFRRRTRGRDVVPGPRQVSCTRCGQPFMAQSPLAKYCSPCRPAADRESHRKRERRARLARGPLQVTCARCGQRFIAKNSLAKYCSTCKPAAARQRRQERECRARDQATSGRKSSADSQQPGVDLPGGGSQSDDR